MSKPDRRIATESRLRFVCKKWQKRLGLADWDVLVRFAKQHEMQSSTGEAQIEPLPNFKRAELLVLSPDDWNPKTWHDQDTEASVIHELLHLHFDYWMSKTKSAAEELLMEQGLGAIERALVRLGRIYVELGDVKPRDHQDPE